MVCEIAAQSPPAKKNLQDPGDDFNTIARKALIAHPRAVPSWIFSTMDMFVCAVAVVDVDGATIELSVCPGSVEFPVTPTAKGCKPIS